MSRPDPEAVRARIRARNDAWREAAARNDLEGMLAIYAADARELLPGMPAVEGRETIRDFYAGLIERFPRFRNDFEPEEILVGGSADLAVARGRFRFTPDTDQPDDTQQGKYVGVWRRVEGEWRLAINISHADEPRGGE